MGLIRGGRREIFAVLTVGVGLLFCALAAPPAEAGISCRYVAAGPDGPAGNRLELKVTRFEEVVAVLPGKGQNIQVTDDQRMKPLRCKGGKPTMVNLDRIDFIEAPSATGSSFYIAEAPRFGPGATPASAGGKGISFIAKGPAVSFGIGGTEGADLVQMGMVGKAAALDFYPDQFADGTPGNQVDAKIYAKFVNLLVKAGPGSDVVNGSRYAYWNASMDGALKAPASIYGEGGSDELIGGLHMDYIDGGAGADFLSGSAGADQLFGGGGIDTFSGGPGSDEIDAIDRNPGEEIRCGRGKDLARMDLKDRDRDCEAFRFP
jgi:hypothetical protein